MNNCKERILLNLQVLRNISPQFKWLQHLNIDIQPTQTRKSRTICSKWSQTLPTLQALHVGEHDDPKSLHGTIVGPGPRKDTYLLKFLGLIPKWSGILEFHRGRICQTSIFWGFNILVSRVCVFCCPLHQNEGPEKIWKPWTQTCKKKGIVRWITSKQRHLHSCDSLRNCRARTNGVGKNETLFWWKERRFSSNNWSAQWLVTSWSPLHHDFCMILEETVQFQSTIRNLDSFRFSTKPIWLAKYVPSFFSKHHPNRCSPFGETMVFHQHPPYQMTSGSWVLSLHHESGWGCMKLCFQRWSAHETWFFAVFFRVLNYPVTYL